jgi:ABC-type polysaccharide/polyol phosphate export permease
MAQHIKHFFKYRDLLVVFIWREFSVRYKQSIFGVLWAILQPLSMTLIFTVIFTHVLPVPMEKYPPAIFYFAGLLPWTFFATSLNYSIRSLVSHYNLIRKIYFPRIILPFAGIAIAFVDFLIASIVFIILAAYYHISLFQYFFWALALFLLLFIFTVSVSLVFSALNVYYRDVSLATNFFIQLWFFATPVFYSVDRASGNLKILLFLNPLTFIIENFRRSLVEQRPVIGWQYAVMFLSVLILLFLSYKFFKITEKKFADVI